MTNRRFYLTASIFSASGVSAVSCTGATAWESKVYTEGAKVHYQNQLFTQSWYAAPADVPSSSSEGGPWVYVGDCDPGTAEDVYGASVDCSTATPYDATKIYQQGDKIYTTDSEEYAAQWYVAAGVTPDRKNVDNGWKYLGSCTAGTMKSADDSVPTVDCSDAFPWTAKPYGADEYAKVHKDGDKYIQRYYAEIQDVPTRTPSNPDSFPWAFAGKCIEGTDGAGPDTGINTPIDCTQITPWVGRKIYSNVNTTASFQGGVYTNKYYVQAVAPIDFMPENGDFPWSQIGKCVDGTEQPTPDTDLPEEMAKMLCSCCKGCADVDSMNPVCKDTVTDMDKCYFTDCTKFNTFDEAKCEDVRKEGLFGNYQGTISAPTATWPKKLYAPYVDSGLYPFAKLGDIAAQTNVKFFILAFITAATGQTISGCRGGFAGVMPVSAGPSAWNTDLMANEYLYDEINKLRSLGGDVSVSFGGAMGTELADMKECQEGDAVQNLIAAYSEVIDYLKLQQIDFDIEGGAASSVNAATGWTYRFQAVKGLMQKYPNLQVSWTLPILPGGLTEDGNGFLTALMASGLPIYRINVMTMDYGASECPGTEMGRCERDAVKSLANQVFAAAQAAGRTTELGWTSAADTYPVLGTTPMVGMNDSTDEFYTLEDAKASLQEWQTNQPVGFISNWSLHRDDPCPAVITYVDTKCSGEPNQKTQYEFADIFKVYTSA